MPGLKESKGGWKHGGQAQQRAQQRAQQQAQQQAQKRVLQHLGLDLEGKL